MIEEGRIFLVTETISVAREERLSSRLSEFFAFVRERER